MSEFDDLYLTIDELDLLPEPEPLIVDMDTREIVLPNGYRVDLDRCMTHEQVLNWVMHLAEKNWVDTPLLRKVAIIALNSNGLRWPQS
ncbi:MAG: hypothetical protein WCN81_00180 [Actinomycetes bacterium]